MPCLLVALVTFGESFGDVDAEDDSHHAIIIDVSGHTIDIYKHDRDSNDDGQCDRLHDSNYVWWRSWRDTLTCLNLRN